MNSTLLAIDARHLGFREEQAVVAEYLNTYPSPSEEFGFREAWIIGPRAKDCARLSIMDLQSA
ncbi:MAG: hypothetical protein M3P12_11160 [Gemmatimonadota bacterium]|nr:hypothetical protein [Gemmatimonadota bacterium]